MASQEIVRSPHHRVSTLTTQRKRLLGIAQCRFEEILAFYDASDVKDVRLLRDYCDRFLALPADVLRDWELMDEETLKKLGAKYQ